MYRYGFQGQETDFEVKNITGGSVNYKYRMHDPRLGRFFARDPLFKKYPMLTPYQFSSLNPIGKIEIEGLEGVDIRFRMWEAQRNAPKLGITYSEYIEETRPDIHLGLDLIGFVPFVGEVADGINAAIYTYEGDYLNAAFSTISIAPIGGDIAAKGIKYSLKYAGDVSGLAKGGGRTFKSLNAAKKWVGNAVEYGIASADAIANKSKLRGALGLKTGDGLQAHHIIPVELIKSNSTVRKALDEGFDFNGMVNGLGLNKNRHYGSHRKYTQKVNEMIDAAQESMPDASAKDILENVARDLKDLIKSTSKKVNDL